VPAELNAEEAARILGGQANLWTEYIATGAHAEYMLFPRLAALAEAVWSQPPAMADFTPASVQLDATARRHHVRAPSTSRSPRLGRLGWPYLSNRSEPEIRFGPTFRSRLYLSLSTSRFASSGRPRSGRTFVHGLLVRKIETRFLSTGPRHGANSPSLQGAKGRGRRVW
jgi:hypothetical protein